MSNSFYHHCSPNDSEGGATLVAIRLRAKNEAHERCDAGSEFPNSFPVKDHGSNPINMRRDMCPSTPLSSRSNLVVPRDLAATSRAIIDSDICPHKVACVSFTVYSADKILFWHKDMTGMVTGTAMV